MLITVDDYASLKAQRLSWMNGVISQSPAGDSIID
jgi:hypothetical protein